MKLRIIALLFCLTYSQIQAQNWKLEHIIGGETENTATLRNLTNFTFHNKNLYVFESGRIVVCDSNGNILKKIGYRKGDNNRFIKQNFYINEDISYQYFDSDLMNNRLNVDFLNWTNQICLDSQGNIYKNLGDCISLSDKEGDFIKNILSQGQETGYCEGILGFTLDKEDNIYIQIEKNILIYDKNLKFIENIDISCAYERPSNNGKRCDAEIWIDNNKNIFVQGYRQICVFNPEGKLIRNIDAKGHWGLNSNDILYVLDEDNLFTFQNIGRKDEKVEIIKKGQKKVYGVYPNDEGGYYLQKSESIIKYNKKGHLIKEFFQTIDSDGVFNEPHGLSVTEYGEICVIDKNFYYSNSSFDKNKSYRVQMFDNNYQFLREFKLILNFSALDSLRRPKKVSRYSTPNIAIENNGNINLAYNWTFEKKRVKVYDTKGNLKNSFSNEGKASELKNAIPVSITYDTQGNCYLADKDSNKIYVYDKNKNLIKKFGEKGVKDWQLDAPHGISVDNQGKIYIIDQSPFIKIFDNNGKFLKKIGSTVERVNEYYAYIQNYDNALKDSVLKWCYPNLDDKKKLNRLDKYTRADGLYLFNSGISIDENGKIYITDKRTYQVIIYKTSGELEESFKYSILKPHDIGGYANIVAKNDKIYIVDEYYENGILVFSKKL